MMVERRRRRRLGRTPQSRRERGGGTESFNIFSLLLIPTRRVLAGSSSELEHVPRSSFPSCCSSLVVHNISLLPTATTPSLLMLLSPLLPSPPLRFPSLPLRSSGHDVVRVKLPGELPYVGQDGGPPLLLRQRVLPDVLVHPLPRQPVGLEVHILSLPRPVESLWGDLSQVGDDGADRSGGLALPDPLIQPLENMLNVVIARLRVVVPVRVVVIVHPEDVDGLVSQPGAGVKQVPGIRLELNVLAELPDLDPVDCPQQHALVLGRGEDERIQLVSGVLLWHDDVHRRDADLVGSPEVAGLHLGPVRHVPLVFGDVPDLDEPSLVRSQQDVVVLVHLVVHQPVLRPVLCGHQQHDLVRSRRAGRFRQDGHPSSLPEAEVTVGP
mmetsp:Transcript_8810/g.29413  ORF Transcript_8810/g.29413 Transcript_8810/m.29413 type:complete len:382 (-) Transcript_8810:2542-3687(-)